MNRTRLKFLDGLRGLCALWVLLSHVWIARYGQATHDGLLGACTNWLLYSHFAVDTFIVLSGYCLMLPIKGPMERRAAIGFYKRRARRILPPFYVALALGLGVALITGAAAITPHRLVANLLMLQDISTSWNIYDFPLWSVAVEYRIYFLFPVILWLIYRYGVRFSLIVFTILSYVGVWVIWSYEPRLLTMSPQYLALFVMGVGACYLATSRTTNDGFLKTALVAFTIALVMIASHPISRLGCQDFGLETPWIDAFVGAGVASTLALLSRSRTPTLLDARPLINLGGWSYSLYLTHAVTLTLIERLVPPHSQPFAAWAAAAIGCALIVAYTFHVFVERPFISSVRRPSEYSVPNPSGSTEGSATPSRLTERTSPDPVRAGSAE